MVDYEKGVPGWDIGIILTRHNTVGHPCARVYSLRRTAQSFYSTEERLSEALKTPCTCGVGDSDAEKTSLMKGANDAGELADGFGRTESPAG